MKLSTVLRKQHLGRMFNFHWYLHGKKKVARTSAKQILEEKGFVVEDGINFVKPPAEKIEFKCIGSYEHPIPLDQNHPDYQEVPCFTYNDSNVLVGGLNQAAVLTNTCVIKDNLPGNLHSLQASDEIHDLVQRVVKLSCIFDAEQKKLPKRKDPLRPAWVFPRDYGITDIRKNTILCNYLADICAESQTVKKLSVVENTKMVLPLEAYEKHLRFDLTAEVLLTSQKPNAIPSIDVSDQSLPNIFPLHPTISFGKEHFYSLENIFPLKTASTYPHVHTAFLHINPTEIKNVYETDVTDDQLDGRALIKGFTVAAAQARCNQMLQNGEDVKDPVAVRIVHVNGQSFTLGVFILNTLKIDESNNARKNVFWISPPESLYSKCAIVEGRPILEGYNPFSLDKLISFTTTDLNK